MTSLKSILWGAASMLVLVAGGAQAQNPSAVHDALINQMNAATAPTLAATIAEGQRRVCRDIFAQSGESYSLRQARLTHPDLPRDFGATVEDLLCDPKAMAGLATVTLEPTRSWLWNGYNLTVDHGDTVVTGRLVEDGDQPGAWTVTHVDMPGIDRDAARSNNLGCFFEPRMCRAAR